MNLSSKKILGVICVSAVFFSTAYAENIDKSKLTKKVTSPNPSAAINADTNVTLARVKTSPMKLARNDTDDLNIAEKKSAKSYKMYNKDGERISVETGIESTDRKDIKLFVNQGRIIKYSPNIRNLFLAQPEVADLIIKSPGVAYIIGKQIGETTLILADRNVNKTITKKIMVGYDIDALKKAIKIIEPKTRIKITTLANGVMLTGSVRSAKEAENIVSIVQQYIGGEARLLNFMKIRKSQQVYLKVQIIEMSRGIGRNLGIQWTGFYGNNHFGAIVNPDQGFGDGAGGFVLGGFAQDDIDANGDISNVWGIGAIIQALDRRGMITILSEPNLTTVSGQQASFLAGGEFPVVVAQGFGTNSIEYYPYGVNLSFNPTVLDDDTISLRVAPQVSELSEVGAVKLFNFSIPALTVRRAETTIQLRSGQAFAIAGLLENNMRQAISRVPVLGELPILGPLFRSRNYQRNETELVIIVTPYLVNPNSSSKFASPLMGLDNIDQSWKGNHYIDKTPGGYIIE